MEQVDASGDAELDFAFGETSQSIIDIRVFYQLLPELDPLFALIPAMLMSLIVIVTVRSLKGFTRWLGWIFVFSSVLLLNLLLIVSLGLLNIREPQNPPEDVPPELLELVIDIANGILTTAFSQASQEVVGVAAGLIIFGGILLGISVIAPGPEAVVKMKGQPAQSLLEGA